MRTWPVLLLLVGAAWLTIQQPAAAAPDRAQVERDFAAWVDGPLWRKAEQRGISRAVFDAALRGVGIDWTLPDLDPKVTGVPDEPPRQSEFRAPGLYFKPSQVDTAVTLGAEQLAKWRDTLQKIERRFGVPGEIIIAIWGRETLYGRAPLTRNAISALASQAFIGRRPELFETELLAALEILQQGHIAPAAMKSAWAGALGQPQFMPTAFLKYAVDFDGDGRKDIWSSVPDTLASIGHFLQQSGWQRGDWWGAEASVPDAVSCTLEGPDQRIALARWRQWGLRLADGRSEPRGEDGARRFLLMPAGRLGPAFLVSGNFFVIKQYNESDVYALFVGLVADRLRGGSGFRAPFRPIDSFGREQVRVAQQRLEQHGHDVGSADGLIGYKTRIAVGNWQQAQGRAVTCFPAAAELSAIE
jgi:lytic murein transglycosylase